MSIDLVNLRFGRLVVVEQAGKNKWNKRLWLCHCDCGEDRVILENRLKSGETRSCKCLQRDGVITRNTKHNHAKRKNKSKIYSIWTAMIQRCTNQNSKDYFLYGGRGILVCEHWKQFSNFLEDMGEAPEGCQIDRINNNGDYCKENCHWVTTKQNNRNKRNNHLATHNGKIQCLSAWAEEYGINYKLLWKRICVYNWPIARALDISIKNEKVLL